MTTDLSRRHFVQSGTSLALVAGLAVPTAANAQTASSYAAVRAKWKRYQTAAGTGYSATAAPYSIYIAGLNTEVAGYIGTLDFGNPELFNDTAVTAIADYGRTTRVIMGRLRMMAIAYGTPGATQYNNATLRDNIIRALGYISASRYYNNQKFATTTSTAPNTIGPATYSGNQYMWQIGLPRPLLDTLIIMYAEIVAKTAGQIPGTSVSGATLISNLMSAVRYHNPDPRYYSGYPAGAANLAWNGQIYLLMGMLTQNATTVDLGYTVLQESFRDVTSKDGFYLEGSFVQHGSFAYTGGYGLGLLEIAASSINLLTGTAWPMDSTSVAKVTQWVTRSFDPVIYRGGLMSLVKGRTMARSYDQESASGNLAAASVILLSEVVPDAGLLRSMVKGWLAADTTNSFYTYAVSGVTTLYTWRLRETIVNAATARGDLQGHFRFPIMDRVIHRRPAFSLGLAMMSTRIANYESIGAENLRGWYQGAGTTYLYNGTGSHYRDAYWPTVDPYRMPGTTVDTRTLSAAQHQDTRGVSLAGGAHVGVSGVAGMIHGAYFDYDGSNVRIAGTEDLKAYKSYFMFGDYVMCAGTGISNTAANSVETIIENRNIGASGTNAVTVNDVARLTSIGTVAQTATTSGPIVFSRTSNQTQQLAAADAGTTTWVHIDGIGGYLIPSGNPRLVGVREARTGRWQNINNSSGNDPAIYTRRYVTIWLDHGASPQSTGNGTYSYIIAPISGSAATTKVLAATPPIILRTNTTTVQYATAQFSTTFLSGAMFWTDTLVGSTASNPFIRSNRRAAVFVRETPGLVEIGVSDPTGSATTAIVINVALPTTSVASTQSGLTVTRTTTVITLTLNPTGLKGQTRVATLSR